MSFARSLVLAAVLALAAAAAAHAADTPAEVAREPSDHELDAVTAKLFPNEPRVTGRAVARCHVSAAGALSDCSIVLADPSETPMAKLLLATIKLYKVKPATQDGQPVDSQILIDQQQFVIDTPARWIRRPSRQDLLAVWPKAALGRDVHVKVLVSCMLGVQGALYDCVALSETPAGLDFGAAAVAITPQLQMQPAQLNGRPVAVEVQIPIKFEGNWPTATNGLDTEAMATPAMTWPQAPTYADVAAAYPRKARERRIAGRATLVCEIDTGGRLRSCTKISEEPFGGGFVDAARALVQDFRAPTTTAGGNQQHGVAVMLPFTFDPRMLGGAQVIGKPQWTALPSTEDLKAAMKGLPSGIGDVRVVMSCTVAQVGRMDGCKVDSETPPGDGYGAAALALAPKIRVATWTAEGLPVVGATVRVPIRFETGAAAPQPTPSAAPAKAP